MRKSDCAVAALDGGFTLVKNATVMSYGAQADAIVATARRTPDAPPTDQVLVAIVKEDYRLEHLVESSPVGRCESALDIRCPSRRASFRALRRAAAAA